MAKTSLAALLVVGLALIPAGIIANVYLGNEIGNAVPSTLLTIQETAEGEIEDELWIVANADALAEIRDLAYEKLPEFLNETTAANAINQTLQGLVSDGLIGMNIINATTAVNVINQTLDGLVYQGLLGMNIINATVSAQLINQSITTVILQNSTTPTFAKEQFFNNYTYQSNFTNSPIAGISEYWSNFVSGTNLSYSATGQDALLYGAGGLPGLITDLDTGTGLLGFMALMDNATDGELSYFGGSEISDVAQQAALSASYACSWMQLTNVSNYIENYLWANVVELTILVLYGLTPEQYAHVLARELYFNDPDWSTTTQGLAPIQGISEYWDNLLSTGNLSFTPTGQISLLFGANGLPGFFDDLDMGTGLLGFMGLMANATDGELSYFGGSEINDATQQGQMAALYSCSWMQLVNVSGYITNYMWAQITYPTVVSQYSMTPLELAHTMAREFFFNDPNWSETTMGLAPFNGTSQIMTNGLANLSYTEEAQKRILFGYGGLPGITDDLSFGSGMIGFLLLYDNATDGENSYMPGVGTIPDATQQTVLGQQYNCTWLQYQNVSLYLRNYIFPNIVPAALLAEYGTAVVEDVVPLLVFDQWTEFGITGGDPLNLKLLEEDLPDDVYGLEVGTVISDTIAKKLWEIDEEDDMALTSRDGQVDWHAAWEEGSGGDTFEELKDHFGLSTAQTEAIADWLYEGDDSFQQLALPSLFEYDQGVTIPRKAVILFLEQWANQTIDGDETYPDGLPLGEDPEGNDITGIELAEDSGIEIDTAEDLWDEDNELAFTNDAGIQKWYTAADENSDAYEELKDEFDLSDKQMGLITDWLQTFKSDTLPKLAEDQTGTNPALLQTGLTWGLISVGAVMALAGGILLKKRS